MKLNNNLKETQTQQTGTTQATFNLKELKIRQLKYQKNLMNNEEDRPSSRGRPQTQLQTTQDFIQTKLTIKRHQYSNKPKRFLALTNNNFRTTQSDQQFFENFMPNVEEIQGYTSSVANLKIRGFQSLSIPYQPIPDEDEVKKTFRFKLPCIVAQQENQRTQTHFLEGFIHPQDFIETYIAECKRIIEELKSEKEVIRKEIKVCEDRNNKEIEQIVEDVQTSMDKLQRAMKEDSVTHQSEQFRLNKQIMILNKEKNQLEQEIIKVQGKINRQETILQGVECFNLWTDDQDIQNITLNNLRQDRTNISFKDMIH